MNYLTKFDLYVDIELIVYMFYAKILFKLMLEDSKKWRCSRRNY